MIKIQDQFNLKQYNTFGITAHARYFTDVSSEHQLREVIDSSVYRDNKVLILGGGSNILFTKDFNGLVVHNNLKGIDAIDTNDHHVTIKVAAGEIWHDVVIHAITNNWGGIENLSLIPGTVGAAPMQNIGAYGVEVKEVIVKVDAVDRSTGTLRSFTKDECRFGYRESVFKHELKEKYFISSVTLTLTNNKHQLNTSYGAIADTLKQMNVTEPTIRLVSDAVIRIRRSKLPDPNVIGNAGSFFKNPVINADHYNTLKKQHPLIPGYQSENQQVKVPAGWLIEQCALKGLRLGNVGVHEHQALVLVNYGNGSGEEILELSKKIQEIVKDVFGIELIAEVNII
ncbi:MAG TPA: UDP-N-acetylmuramate dehydrogenase [Cyclobacteriaceae bacterium]|nr:UDP-N-acetylmuramate dehydrogenase [Cyclobacteriaceae bacterium]